MKVKHLRCPTCGAHTEQESKLGAATTWDCAVCERAIDSESAAAVPADLSELPALSHSEHLVSQLRWIDTLWKKRREELSKVVGEDLRRRPGRQVPLILMILAALAGAIGVLVVYSTVEPPPYQKRKQGKPRFLIDPQRPKLPPNSTEPPDTFNLDPLPDFPSSLIFEPEVQQTRPTRATVKAQAAVVPGALSAIMIAISFAFYFSGRRYEKERAEYRRQRRVLLARDSMLVIEES